MELLEVGLVATRPVGRLLDVGLAKNLENLLKALVVDDVTNADKIKIAGWHSHNQIVLSKNSQNEVELFLALDSASLDVLDHSSAMIRVDNGFTNVESHLCGPFRGLILSHNNC